VQGITHILAGALIQKQLDSISNKFVRVSAIAGLGLLSHGILDRLAKATYHPPHPMWNDPFWVTYHLFIYSSSIFAFYKLFGSYKLGVIFAILPDLDWLVIHPLNLFNIAPPNFVDLHGIVYAVTDRIPLVNQYRRLPNLNLVRWSAIFEVLLLLVLILIFQRSSKQAKKE
jgi:hypothetical protein